MINLCTTALDRFTDYWPWRNFSDWVIFGGKNSFFKKKLCHVRSKRRDWTRALQPVGMVPKQWTYRGIIDFEGIFRIGSFLGKKKNFFEKNFVVEWFWRRNWARAFKLGGMIRYILGSGLLKKNSRFSDFLWKLWPVFKNWTLPIFLKLSIWHQHDQFMHHSTGPIYQLLTLKEFFQIGSFFGGKTAFKKKKTLSREK